MNLGFTEMAFLFLLALLIFGPRKLPEIGRQIGKALSEFKRASNDFKAQIQTEIDQIDLEEQRRQVMEMAQPVIDTVSSGSLNLEPAPAPTSVPAPEAISAPKAQDV